MLTPVLVFFNLFPLIVPQTRSLKLFLIIYFWILMF